MEKQNKPVASIKEAREYLIAQFKELKAIEGDVNRVHRQLMVISESAGIPQATAKRFASEFIDVLRLGTIANCSASSIMGAYLSALRLNLPLSVSAGMVFFVPFKGSCTMQLSYKGLAALATRRYPTLIFAAEMVLKDESFAYKIGNKIEIEHTIKPTRNRYTYNGNLVGVYATARNINTGVLVNASFLSFQEIEALRVRNPSQKQANPSSAWNTDYVAMAYAKAIKQLLRAAGMVELEYDGRAIEVDTDGNERQVETLETEAEVLESAESIFVRATAILENADATREQLEEIQHSYIKICGEDSWVNSHLSQKFIARFKLLNQKEQTTVEEIQPRPLSDERKAEQYILRIKDITSFNELGNLHTEAMAAFNGDKTKMEELGVMSALKAQKAKIQIENKKGGNNA